MSKMRRERRNFRRDSSVVRRFGKIKCCKGVLFIFLKRNGDLGLLKSSSDGCAKGEVEFDNRIVSPFAEEIKPRLGLVCITASDAVRFRTTTRKRLLQMSADERRATLRALYADNLARLERAIDFCIERNVKLYRVTSALLPFADDEAGASLLDEFSNEMRRVGAHAIKSGVRLVLHPDQFVVLNSDSEQVRRNSRKILETHARIFDLLAQPRSEWAAMNIHGGKGGRADQLVAAIKELPENVRSRLTLENDEYIYSAAQILDICRRARVPMIFDAHHHICRENLSSYDDECVIEMFDAARTTWLHPEWQIVHISNGRNSFNDRSHSDFIDAMPEIFRRAPYIEVEAKSKELAIERLQEKWL